MNPFALPISERQAWLLDQRINERGIFVDRALLDGAMKIAGRAKDDLYTEIKKITHVENPNSGPQMIAWLRLHKYPFSSLEKSWVARALAEGVPDDVRRVLELRSEAAKTSDSKLQAIANVVSADGRVRHLFNFMGAARTGRWTSSRIQFQNLPKPLFQDDKEGTRLKIARELIRACEYESLKAEFGSAITPVISVIRTIFCASPGHRFVMADLSAIEARMVAWLAECSTMLGAFRARRDIYVEFAAQVLGKTREGISKDERNKVGKVGILACGYGQGAGGQRVDEKSGALVKHGLWGYAHRQGIDLTLADAEQIVATYRQAYPQVPQLWRDYEEGFRWTLETGAEVEMHRVCFRRIGRGRPTIQIELPSGRCLHYVNSRIGTKTRDDGNGNVWQSDCVLYDGINQKTRTWGAVDTWGGKITENLDQAISRDILAAGMLRVDALMPVVAHCHDEVICEVPEASSLGTDDLVNVLTTPPEWAPDIPLAAEGEFGPFYKK
jgi:DNA polymerase